MAKIDKNKELQPSILDKLTGNTLNLHGELASTSFQRVKQLRQTVRRDLENLFNTRFRILDLPEEYPELETSLLNYGLPDLATINMLDQNAREGFCRFMEDTIRRYEPRFKNVKVSHAGVVDETDRSLRFRIEAVLYADPLPETIVFNSILEPVTRSVKIEDTFH